MKDWLDKRLAELNKLGGKWRMIETKHFYCFADIDEAKHTRKSPNEWNEGLYKLLCDVLRHKEGEKLWNNKMPIYYFDTFRLFQSFAVEIDKSPGARSIISGGYFSFRGRDVHICIPFMSERSSGKKMGRCGAQHGALPRRHACLPAIDRRRRTQLHRWPCMKAWRSSSNSGFEDAKSSERKERIRRAGGSFTRRKIRTCGRRWRTGPGGGTDLEGYAYSWSKAMFLYQYPDIAALPNMVKLIKQGKTEKEAMEATFKRPLAQLEAMYDSWLPGAIKAGVPPPQRH